MIPSTLFALEAHRLSSEAIQGGYSWLQIVSMQARAELAERHARRARKEQPPVRISLKEVR